MLLLSGREVIAVTEPGSLFTPSRTLGKRGGRGKARLRDDAFIKKKAGSLVTCKGWGGRGCVKMHLSKISRTEDRSRTQARRMGRRGIGCVMMHQ